MPPFLNKKTISQLEIMKIGLFKKPFGERKQKKKAAPSQQPSGYLEGLLKI